MSAIRFTIVKKLESAMGRAGILKTHHGEILTPAFVAVGTKGTVKSLTPEQIRDAGLQVVLANTYHLYLEPGHESIQKLGGLSQYMNWNGPTMTDSGGFQVFSLGAGFGKQISKITKTIDPNFLIPERSIDSPLVPLAKIGADGVSFKSHLDGSLHYITPEKSIEIQHAIGADIIFAFDECTSPTESLRYQEEALGRTHRWAMRSLEYHKSKENKDTQALFGVVQGGRDEELRKRSAKEISEMMVSGEGFDGYGIGGSFAKEDMRTAVQWVNEILPEEKPRHLLGIGEPEDLFMGVEAGVDLFDCVAPTRNARNGTLYTRRGKIHMMNAEYRAVPTPIEDGCGCYACTHYSCAYVAHLYHAKEMLAGTLGSIHNLYFISHLVSDMRQSIIDGNFAEFKKSFLAEYLS